MKKLLQLFLIVCFLELSISLLFPLYGQSGLRHDPCLTNDLCETATLIPNVVSDSSFICVDGCTIDAQPETFTNPCGIDTFPTVWFEVHTDELTTNLNIRLSSSDINFLIVSLFLNDSGCSSLKEVDLPILVSSCRIGGGGKLNIYDIHVLKHSNYFIAVSSPDTTRGHFHLCVSTFFDQNECVQSTDVEVKSRSMGGSLDGPFLPGETVSVCMNVNSYSAANNGCQWFQGLIPLFGDSWDPSSFNSKGQPIQTSINGFPMGEQGNGVYGTSTWDWFTDIGYHHTTSVLQIGDFDGNGTLELCHTLYENCPDLGGVQGGCCGPCWATPGQILPPGWFAYGINGSCPEIGHPTKDWGDGNTCGEGMGPWSFCYELKVKPFPDCLVSSLSSDLDLGIFTTSDGETGAWTGGPSVCVNDKPQIRHFQSVCGTEIDHESITLPAICSGELFSYLLSAPDVMHWYWKLDQTGLINQSKGDTTNPSLIRKYFNNKTDGIVRVTYHFKGIVDSTGTYISKDISFDVFPAFDVKLDDSLEICYYDHQPVIISPRISGAGGALTYLWVPGGLTTPDLVLNFPFQSGVHTFIASDGNGCVVIRDINVVVTQDCLIKGNGSHDDQSNDHPTKGDSLAGGGKFSTPGLTLRSNESLPESALKVYPVPASDNVVIEWSFDSNGIGDFAILNMQGKIIARLHPTEQENANHRISFNLSEISSGIYFVSVISTNGIHNCKLIKI